MTMIPLPSDPFHEWQKKPVARVSFILPLDVMKRLNERAREAELLQEDGSPDLTALLYRAWIAHEGCVCTAALQAVEADDSDPDMQVLQRTNVTAAMERGRPN